MEFVESQLHLFRSQYLSGLFLEEMRQKALKSTGLPITTRPAESFENVIIEFPYLQLWGTPDNPQTRDQLAHLIVNHLQDMVRLRSITKLGSEGIRIVASARGLKYRLVISIGYVLEGTPRDFGRDPS